MKPTVWHRRLRQNVRTWILRQRSWRAAPPNAPTIDLIFAEPQPWILSEGWIPAFAGVAKLGRVWRVTPRRHQHIWPQLEQSQATATLAIGFDHHTPFLHDTPAKLDFWRKRRCPLLPIFYERIVGTPYSWNEELSRRAATVADLIIYNCGSDESFIEEQKRPHLWQPFGIDPHQFKSQRPFQQRHPRFFFDGKTEVSEVALAYRERADFVQAVKTSSSLDLLPHDKWLTADALAQRYNSYQGVLNPPSIYSGHTCRVWEALACGCFLMTPHPTLKNEAELFQDGKELCYYDRSRPEIARQEMEQKLSTDAARRSAQEIAERGHRLVMQQHTLQKRLAQIWQTWTSCPTQR